MVASLLLQSVLAVASPNPKGASNVGAHLLQRAYKYKCLSNESQFQKLTKEISIAYPQYHESVLWGVFNPAGNEEEVKRILTKSPPLGANDSDDTKLGYAASLITSRSENLELIEKLLDFEAHDDASEANRLTQKRYIAALKGDLHTYGELLIPILERMPILGTSIVMSTFSINKFDPNLKSTIDEVRKILERKVEYSINPEFTRSAIYYLTSDRNLNDGMPDGLESSHRACPGDTAISEFYASILVRQRNYRKAYPILSEVVANREFPPPYAEFLFAQVLHGIGDYDLAIKYYKRTIDPHNIYISIQQKEYARHFLSSAERKRDAVDFPVVEDNGKSWIGSFGLILLLGSPFILVLFALFKKIKERSIRSRQ